MLHAPKRLLVDPADLDSRSSTTALTEQPSDATVAGVVPQRTGSAVFGARAAPPAGHTSERRFVDRCGVWIVHAKPASFASTAMPESAAGARRRRIERTQCRGHAPCADCTCHRARAAVRRIGVETRSGCLPRPERPRRPRQARPPAVRPDLREQGPDRGGPTRRRGGARPVTAVLPAARAVA